MIACDSGVAGDKYKISVAIIACDSGVGGDLHVNPSAPRFLRSRRRTQRWCCLRCSWAEANYWNGPSGKAPSAKIKRKRDIYLYVFSFRELLRKSIFGFRQRVVDNCLNKVVIVVRNSTFYAPN